MAMQILKELGVKKKRANGYYRYKVDDSFKGVFTVYILDNNYLCSCFMEKSDFILKNCDHIKYIKKEHNKMLNRGVQI